MSRTEIRIRIRRLRRQIAQHQGRGVPAACLADLIAELAALEALLVVQLAVLLTGPVGES